MEIEDEAADGSDVPDGPQWPPSELVLVLRSPVTDKAGSEIAELHLREPTDDEWTKFSDHPEATRRRYAISTIAKIPMEAAAKIAIGDAVRAEAYLGSFFEFGQAIRDW